MNGEYEVKTIIYRNAGAMKHGKERMARDGWEIIETITLNGRYGCINTGCLGCLFLPLALAAKSGDRYQVTYRRPKVEESDNQYSNSNRKRTQSVFSAQWDKIERSTKLLIILGLLALCFICGIIGKLMPQTNTNNITPSGSLIEQNRDR